LAAREATFNAERESYAQALMGMDLTGWDSTLWRLPYWDKQA